MRRRCDKSCGIVPLQKRGGKWTILLISQGGTWSFPKGHAEPGESPKQTAERELREETNLSVARYLSHNPLEESYTFVENQILIEKSVLYFPALVEGDLQLQLEEISQGRWLPLELAGARLTHFTTRQIWQGVRELAVANLSES